MKPGSVQRLGDCGAIRADAQRLRFREKKQEQRTSLVVISRQTGR